MVGISFLGSAYVGLTHHNLTHYHKSENDAHHTERICHRACQRGTSHRHAEHLERLLGRTESRCIRRGATQHTHKIADSTPPLKRECQCHDRAEKNDA